jgi:hypothetical protein
MGMGEKIESGNCHASPTPDCNGKVEEKNTLDVPFCTNPVAFGGPLPTKFTLPGFKFRQFQTLQKYPTWTSHPKLANY